MCPSGRIAGVSCPRPNGSGITALCDRGCRTSVKRRRLRRLPGYGAIRAWRIKRRNDNAVKERPRPNSNLRLGHFLIYDLRITIYNGNQMNGEVAKELTEDNTSRNEDR